MNTITYNRIRRVYTVNITYEDMFIETEYKDDPDGVNLLFNYLSKMRVNFVYCWDGAKLFADFDNWAMRMKLTDYDVKYPADGRGYRPRVVEECYSVRDGDQAYYSRRYWLKTANANTGDRHKRLHGVTLVNAQNYFGGHDLEEILNTFQADSLNEVMREFSARIHNLTGFDLYDEYDEKPNFLTLGAISKAFYLSLKYPDLAPAQRLKQYQVDHPSDKAIERELRCANLLAGGIIYMKDRATHYNLYKYDKVSLFPSVERNLPALGIPREIPVESFSGHMQDEYEYIFIFKSLTLKRKNHMPAMYPPQEGYTGENKDVISVENEALFAPLYFAYLDYYDVIESEIGKIYRCRKIPDPAIKGYVDTLFAEKDNATDPAYYFVIKLILNNLHGKFAQNPITPTFTRNQGATGAVERHQNGLKDNWKIGHFDYVRGAYIYSMARTKMLRELVVIAQNAWGITYRLVDHLYYSDTDSAILDVTIALEGFVGRALGQFKYEGRLEKFKAYAPKIYAYYSDDGAGLTPVLKCAGAKANEIINFYYCCNPPYVPGAERSDDLIEFLNKEGDLPITTLHRTPTGAEYIREYRPLTRYGDFDEEGGEL